jgi:hypothetical protein
MIDRIGLDVPMSGEMTRLSADRPALHGMIERLPEPVNRDAVLLRRGRHLDLDIVIEIGSVHRRRSDSIAGRC